MIQCTLVQSIGEGGEHVAYVIPNDRLSPKDVEALARLNGEVSGETGADEDWEVHDALLEKSKDCKRVDDCGGVQLNHGECVTRICQTFYLM